MRHLSSSKKPRNVRDLGANEESQRVTVNGNWRMTFYFDGQDAFLVDYMDYH